MFTKEFISLCHTYAAGRSDLLSETIDDSKKICAYHIELFGYALEFRYAKKESTYVKPSSLYCLLKLRKNSIVHYHLTDIIPFLENKRFQSCYFWNIESVERLRRCFHSLETVLNSILSQLSPLLTDDSVVEQSLFESYQLIYKLKENSIDFTKINDETDFAHLYFLSLQKNRDEYIFSRYCNFAPYALLLKNKLDKALEKYENLNQKGKLLEYEKSLIHHITHSEPRAFRAFDPACDTSASEKLQSPARLLQKLVICFVVLSVFFCGLFAICNTILSANTLVLLSSPWYMGFLCAGLSSIFGAIALLIHSFRCNHLSREETQNFSAILFSKGLKRFSLVLFVLSFAASVFFAVMMLISNVRFYSDEIRFGKQVYNYDQINSVYRIEARYNVYDERINRASYVILFNDKTSLDLDGYTSPEFTEREVLPLLENHGFSVQFADSERELPWYSEQE